jgi:hypothetical protein
MKPIKTTLLCAALALTFGLPALGEELAAKKPRATTRESRTARPEAAPDAKDYSELSGQVVYQVLLAEMALQRGKTEFASQAYADLAVRSRDPAILQRAIEVAGHARRLDLVLELARLWVEVEPDSQRAQQVWSVS